jgi:AraC-like DNA-binding protein/mannose-6-phosphate isomerase-like protein (cupin superfamily)
MKSPEKPSGIPRFFEFDLTQPSAQVGRVPSFNPSRRPSLAGSHAPPGREERVIRPKVVPVPGFGVAVFESRHGPGFVGELRDEFSKFLLIIAGQAAWEAEGKKIAVTTDSLVHIPAGLSHRQQDSAYDPVVLYAIHYRPTVLPDFLRTDLLKHGLIHWNLSSYVPLLARAVRSDFQEMLFEQGSHRQGWEWVLCSRLIELAVRTIRICHQDLDGRQPLFMKGTDSAERVARYALQLQSRFYQHQTLDEAAVETGLSRRQFTDMFRKVTGESWKQYIHRLRLEHGRKLLLETDTTVTAAAFESGFEDLSYFNHAFKKAYSCSPQAIRNQQAKAGSAQEPVTKASGQSARPRPSGAPKIPSEIARKPKTRSPPVV